MRYAATLEQKRQQVVDCFQRIGGLTVDVPPVLGMGAPLCLPQQKPPCPIGGTAEQPLAGFFAPRSHALIPLTDCPNAMPPAGDILRAFLNWMRTHHVAPYQEENHTGCAAIWSSA